MLSGRVNAGYRVRDGNWLEIGRMSPQKPQVYIRLLVYLISDLVITEPAENFGLCI